MILILALDINLRIGEVVQSLDVKTMAEQWKSYTMICEKYSDFLLDKKIYNNCTKLLVLTIENNIKTALEVTLLFFGKISFCIHFKIICFINN